MRQNKAREYNEIYKKALVKLSNAVTLAALDEQGIRQSFAAVLAFGDERDLRREYPKLHAKPRIREALQLYVRNLDELPQRATYDVSPARKLLLTELQLAEEEKTISRFDDLASKFEVEFLHGDLDSALLSLERIRELTGESLWLIRNKILCLAHSGKLDEMRAYSEICKAQCKDRFTSFLVNCFLFIATDPLLHTRRFIAAAIDELANAEHVTYSDFLALLLSPSPVVRSRKSYSCGGVIQTYPLVDQYVLLRQMLVNNLAIGSGEFAESSSAVDKQYSRLLGRLPQLICSTAETTDIVRCYELGDYDEVINAYSRHSLTAHDSVEVANLVAKASAISGQSAKQRNSPIAELVSALRGLYELKTQPNQYIDSLTSWVIQTNHMMCGPSVGLLLYQALPNQYASQDRAFSARKVVLGYGRSSAWLETLSAGVDPLISHQYAIPQGDLPGHRNLKTKVRGLCAAGEDILAIDTAMQSYSNEAPLKRDYFELASSVYLNQKRMDRLIGIAANALSENSAAFTAFPLARLVEFIEREGRCELDDLLVAYAYVRNVSNEKEYVLNEAFEEYLIREGVERPSEIGASVARSKKFESLLRDIAVMDTLDFLSVFESSDDVRAERIRILDVLLENGSISPDRHRSEVEELLTQAVVDRSATEFSARKIDVNDTAIRRKLSDEVESLFLLYRSSDDIGQNFIRVAEENEERDAAAAVVGDRSTTLLKIFTLVSEAFLYDDKYGLDKNLSVEIRHGFFSNLMRSKLEAHSLLTETDEAGQYKSNEHWKEANTLVSHDGLERIDTHLRWFSKEFNELLAREEAMMKVTTDASDNVRLFNYKLLRGEFAPIQDFASRTDQSGQLLEIILAWLWEKTESHLQAMRDHLDGQFRLEVDNLFAELVGRLNDARGQVAITDLLAAIRQVRNEVREDISTVVEWFKRSEAVPGQMRTLDEIIAISIECYERVRRTQVRPRVETEETDVQVQMSGRQARALVLVMMNLYENCIRHSGFGTKTPITVRAAAQPDFWRLSVSNPVEDTVRLHLQSGELERIHERISAPSYAKLVRVEGRSGLRKISSLLASISERMRLSIELNESDFTAVMNYDAKASVG